MIKYYDEATFLMSKATSIYYLIILSNFIILYYGLGYEIYFELKALKYQTTPALYRALCLPLELYSLQSAYYFQTATSGVGKAYNHI